MSAIEHLLRLSDLYIEAESVKPSTLSSRMLNDGKRLEAIRSGAGIGVRRLEAAIQWMSDHWPHSAAWPSDIPRPAPHEQRASA